MTPRLLLPAPLQPARFLVRPNRFLVRCALEDGPVVEAHVPDRGRLEAVLIPGRRLWLHHAPAPHRKTEWTAMLAETPGGGGLVSLVTTLPNRLIRAALEADALEELAGWRLERAEWTHGGSRFDFLLAHGSDGRRMALEVKSVGLVEAGTALFPDAPTLRGARHLRELAALAATPGWEAAVLFVVQRADATRVRAAGHIDPAFAAALRDAEAAGVRVLARRCRMSLDAVTLGERIPVEV